MMKSISIKGDVVMYNLNLSIEERQALMDVLECSISELHTQIIHTDRYDFKMLLKDRKQVLLKMLDDTRDAQPAA
jgi:hypothetical protein